MREVGVYSVGCSGYGYMVFSHSLNRKISREIDLIENQKRADCFKHKHKTKNRNKHKHKTKNRIKAFEFSHQWQQTTQRMS